MENTRLILAIGLSFLVFFLWSITFGPKPGDKVPLKPQKESRQDTPAGSGSTPDQLKSATPDPVAAESEAGIEAPAETSSRPARTIVVETPLYRMTLSEKGGAIVSMVLKEYRETVGNDAPFKELIPKEIPDGTVYQTMAGVGTDLKKGIFTLDHPQERLDVTDSPVEISFSLTTPNKITVEKRFRFTPDSYLTDLTYILRNSSNAALPGPLKLALVDQSPDNPGAYGFQGPCGLINNNLQQIKIKNIEEQEDIAGSMQWISIERLYFMDSLISKTPIEGQMSVSLNDKIIENRMIIPFDPIAPGDNKSLSFSIFIGPKSLSLLKSIGYNMSKALDFGWFEFIAKPCLYFMNFIYKYIPNYGIAIIILTLITRLIFWPLAGKSYKSMSEMRKVQPLMEEIREKYKDDKVRMNQETMDLYRTYKINPLGGCLPMVIQLPVFFALYQMLYQAIELRHAPFFGWINDLSAPDRLFELGFNIPFMNPPYGIPVLTLIMGATMLLQQKMSPAPGDPTQAKMMMLMPVVFTFIFINFPSGLVLYWLVSNLVSIAQQYFTQKRMA